MLTGIIIGVIWTCWHIPLFWAPARTSLSGGDVTLLGIANYGSVLIILSVVLAVLSQLYGPTLLFALLLHAAWNSQPVRFLFAPVSDEISAAMTATAPFAALAAAIVFCSSLRVWDLEESTKSET